MKTSKKMPIKKHLLKLAFFSMLLFISNRTFAQLPDPLLVNSDMMVSPTIFGDTISIYTVIGNFSGVTLPYNSGWKVVYEFSDITTDSFNPTINIVGRDSAKFSWSYDTATRKLVGTAIDSLVGLVNHSHLPGYQGIFWYRVVMFHNTDSSKITNPTSGFINYFDCPPGTNNSTNGDTLYEYTYTIPPPRVTPLHFLAINAQWADQNARVSWEVSNEQNVSHFELERSLDGNHFEKIGGNIPSIGDHANAHWYSSLDLNAYNTVNDFVFYKIKQVDKDGKSAYSNVVSLSKSKTIKSSTKLFPNPVIDDNFTLQYLAAKDMKLNLQIVDIAGKVIWSSTENVKLGSNSIFVDGFDLSSAMYMLHIEDDLHEVKEVIPFIVK